MKTLSIDTHPHDDSRDKDFYEFLTKAAEEPSVNESGVGGENPDLFTDDEDESHTIDATWGEPNMKNGAGAELQFSPEVMKRYHESRDKMLADFLPEAQSSNKEDQKLVSSLLVNGKSGKYESNSPRLSGEELQKSSSLVSQVQKLTGYK